MGKNMKAVLLIKWNQITTMLVVAGISCICGIITAIVTADASDDVREVILMVIGGVLVGVVPVFNVFLKALFCVDEIYKGLSFGMTRIKLFAISRVYDLVEALIISIVAVLIFGKEYVLVVSLAAAIYIGYIMWVEAVVGNNVIRYGKIVYIVYYVTVLVLLIGAPRVLEHINGFEIGAGRMLAGLVAGNSLSVSAWILVAVFVALGFTLNWITFRKVPVNNVV